MNKPASEEIRDLIGDLPSSEFIGVFDSGLGGIWVLAELIKNMPEKNFVYIGDSANAPYGTKSPDKVLELSKRICKGFIDAGAEAVVIACNTATSAAAAALRTEFAVPIVGMEPAVKPAYLRSLTLSTGDQNSGSSSNFDRQQKESSESAIAVLATPMTLKLDKFDALVRGLGTDASKRIVGVGSPELVTVVEKLIEKEVKVRAIMESYIVTKLKSIENLGSIVLGCTHFMFLKDYFEEILGPDIPIYDGTLGTVKRLNSLIGRRNKAFDSGEKGFIKLLNTESSEQEDLSKRLLRRALLSEEYGYVKRELTAASSGGFLDDDDALALKMLYLEGASVDEIRKRLKWSKKRSNQKIDEINKLAFNIIRRGI